MTLQKSIEGLARPTAFDYCAAVARQAKESITIISPHFTPDNVSPSHDEYLREGLDKAILVAVERSNGNFRYRRIVQLDQSHAEQVNSDGVIDALVIGNKALAAHINQSIIRNAESQSIDVKIYCRTFVPSLPSIMVIDERFVFFSLPYEHWSKKDQSSRVVLRVQETLLVKLRRRKWEIGKLTTILYFQSRTAQG